MIFTKKAPNVEAELQAAERSLTEAKGIVRAKVAELDALEITDAGFAHRKAMIESEVSEAKDHVASIEKRVSRLRQISGAGKLDVQREVAVAEAAVANAADELQITKRRLGELAQAEAERLVAGRESDPGFEKQRTILQSELRQADQKHAAAKEHLERLRAMVNSKARQDVVAKNEEIRKKFVAGAYALLDTYEQCVRRRTELVALGAHEFEATRAFNQTVASTGEHPISRQLSDSRLWELIPVFLIEPQNVKTVLNDARRKLARIEASGGE